MKIRSMAMVVVVVLGINALSVRGQGSLAPSGPPAPTMKTLHQVEPRLAITNLPCEITRSGSYYFVTNLDLNAPSSVGILVWTNDVKIDLNGFTLSGTNGSYYGIRQTLATPPLNRLTVVNGSLYGWGAASISALWTV